MDLKELQSESFTNSANKGFWDDYNNAVLVGNKTLVRALTNEKLLLVTSELTEAMEELRSGHKVDEIYTGDKGKPEGFGVEIADAVIRLFDIAGGVGIDLDALISQKMGYNIASRGHLHGRKF